MIPVRPLERRQLEKTWVIFDVVSTRARFTTDGRLSTASEAQTYLVGDNIQLLLVLPLYVHSALHASKVGNAGSLDEGRNLLAGNGDTGEHNGELSVDHSLLLLLEQPGGEGLDVILALLLLRGFDTDSCPDRSVLLLLRPSPHRRGGSRSKL